MSNVPLVPNEFEQMPSAFGELYTSAKYPDTFVRLSQQEFEKNDGWGYEPIKPINFDTIKEARGLYKELQDKYNIPTVEFNPAIFESSENKLGRGALIASNYLKGEVFNEGMALRQEIPDYAIEAGRKLVENLTKYLLDKKTSETPYLYDIFRISQYTFTDGKFVLHDVDPMIVDTVKDSQGVTIEMRHNLLIDMAKCFMSDKDFRDWQSRTRKVIKAPSAA